MRSFWGVLTGLLTLTVLMQLSNWFFEAAGSVPDLEGCGFFAGGLATLAGLYPVLAGWVGYQFTRRHKQDSDSAMLSGVIGGLGAATYVSLGLTLAVSRGQYSAISPPAAAWSLAYVGLCIAGARIGATVAGSYGRRLALSDTRS